MNAQSQNAIKNSLLIVYEINKSRTLFKPTRARRDRQQKVTQDTCIDKHSRGKFNAMIKDKVKQLQIRIGNRKTAVIPIVPGYRVEKLVISAY